MKVTLIVNPHSGKRKAPTVKAVAQRMADELHVDLHIRTIEGPGHGTELAREALAHGAGRVISAGGDGTLNAVAAGLVGTDTPLGIVPMGSGNGYARSLHLPLKPEQALRFALTGKPRLMDVCYLNDKLFLGTAGIGFDARVAHEFDATAGRGLWNYARIIIKEILGARPMPVVVRTDDGTIEARLLMLVFANTREFGNGAVISPGSAPDDGLAELQLVHKPSLLPMLKAFYDVYTGRADRNRHIRTIVTREAKVQQAGTLAHLDGEPVVIGGDLSFRLEPRRLLVISRSASSQ